MTKTGMGTSLCSFSVQLLHLCSNLTADINAAGLHISVLIFCYCSYFTFAVRFRWITHSLFRRLHLKELQAAMRDLDLVARRVDVVSMLSAHGDGRTVDWKQLSIELSNHFMIQGRMV